MRYPPRSGSVRVRHPSLPMPSVPSLLLRDSYCANGLRATRKPRILLRYDGSSSKRSADRQLPGPPLQPPPRSTRSEPLPWPTGSVPPESFSPYQSEYHSHTLPCMSNNPAGLGFFKPTVLLLLGMVLLCGIAQGAEPKSVTNSIGMELIEIPAGKFVMGKESRAVNAGLLEGKTLT